MRHSFNPLARKGAALDEWDLLCSTDQRSASARQSPTVEHDVLSGDREPVYSQAIGSPALTWEEVWLLSYFSEVAYDTGPLWNRAPFNSSSVYQNLRGWWLPSAALLSLDGSDFDGNGYYSVDRLGHELQAFVAYNEDLDQVVISFRGSEPSLEEWGDWAIDLAIPALLEEMASLFDEFVGAVYRFAADRGAQLLVTGHSLGGALAEAVTHRHPDYFGGGAFFGSPGSVDLSSSFDTSRFLHVTRQQDWVGVLLDYAHAAQTFEIDDYDLQIPGILDGHSISRYEAQLRTIAFSPISEFLPLSWDGVAFLDEDGPNSLVVGGEDLNWGHGVDTILFGSHYRDVISVSADVDAIWADGAGGNDSLSGGFGSDRLSGGSGDDELMGGRGSDHLFGGTGYDTAGFGSTRDLYEPLSGFRVRNIVSGEIDFLGVDIERLRFSDGETITLDQFFSPVPPPPPSPPPPSPPPPPPPSPGDDYGNSAAAAHAISSNAALAGRIEVQGDQDWFAVQLQAGVEYGFAMAGGSYGGVSGLASPHLYLRNAAGDLLEHGSPSSTNSIFRFTPSASGTYYLQARAHGDQGTGAYGLAVTPHGTPPPPDDDDEGDSPAPVRLDLDEVETRVLENDASLIYEIEYDGDLTGEIEIGWELIGAGEDPIEDNDVSRMSGTVTLREHDDDGRVTIRINPTHDSVDEGDEQFILRIRVINGDATIRDNDAWGTIVNDDEGRIHPDIDEHSNGFAGATRIVEDTWNRGFITTPGDVDFFAVYLTAGATYRLTVAGDDDNRLDDTDTTDYIRLSDPQASFYDSNFNLVTAGFQTPVNQSTARFEYTVQNSGMYYIAVREDGDNDIGQYFVQADVWIRADDLPGDASSPATMLEGERRYFWNEREGDDDWILVTLEAGQTYSFFALDDSLSHGGYAFPPSLNDEKLLRLLDLDGSVLAEGFGANGNPDNQLTFTATRSGQFFLSVSSPADDGDFGDGEYLVGFDSVAPSPESRGVIYTFSPDRMSDAYFGNPEGASGNVFSSEGVNSDLLQVGGSLGRNWGSALQFDLDSLPLEADAAYLEIYYTGSTGGPDGPPRPGRTMILGAPGSEWSETSVVTDLGEHYFQSWLTAPGAPGWYRIEITELYNAWQDGTLANRGVTLMPGDINGVINLFLSSDHANAALRPRLIVHEREPGEIRGTSAAEFLQGTDRADLLVGLAGDDLLSGARGADTLDGGAGRDFLNGGDGIDLANYARSNAAVRVNLELNEAMGGHAEGDSLINIENLQGSRFDDVLVGNADANVFIGRAGHDTIHGGAGWDAVSVSGVRADYRLYEIDGGFLLKGLDGRDTLTGVEEIQFGDGSSIELLRMYAEDQPMETLPPAPKEPAKAEDVWVTPPPSPGKPDESDPWILPGAGTGKGLGDLPPVLPGPDGEDLIGRWSAFEDLSPHLLRFLLGDPMAMDGRRGLYLEPWDAPAGPLPAADTDWLF